MDRRTVLQVAGAVGVGALAGCLDNRPSAGADYDVGMSTDAFLPEDITVDVGTTVLWRNTSQTGHTVTAYEGAIPSGAAFFASGEYESESAARDAWADGGGGRIAAGETYEHTFEVPGDYGYFCVPHERVDMVGTIEVTEGGADGGASNASAQNASTSNS